MEKKRSNLNPHLKPTAVTADKEKRKIVIQKLLAADTSNPKVLSGLFDIARNEKDVKLGRTVRELAAKHARTHARDDLGKFFLEMYWDVMLWLAPNDFDSFMLYIEKNRKPEDRFYQPRRRQLKEITEALQALVDDELDQLFLSCPPRIGKSAIVNFFFAWIMGKDPDASNLYSSYSAYVTKTFYNGILEIITDPDTYCYKEIFPKVSIAATDATDLRIDMVRKKKYPTVTCRSIDGALNGGADCNWILCGDDLVEGIEEACSPDRLAKKWSTVLNNLLPRQVGSRGKVLFIGTRWSLADPIGKQIDLLENSPDFDGVRYKVINIPALNDNDESNFDYLYGTGMTTKQYRQRRAAMEESGNSADWEAQYMGNPIERNGQLFNPEMMRFYNGTLPEGEPDRIFAFVDTAFGGGDYVSSPCAYQYGSDVYIHDVVFDDGDKFVTRPLLVEMFERNDVGSATFEGTKTTDDYREWVDNKLREDGYRINITSIAASTRVRKNERIFEKAPEIREFYFRDPAHRNGPYAKFMRNLHSFTMTGRNKHDDAPDSLAGLCDMIRRDAHAVTIFRRPF